VLNLTGDEVTRDERHCESTSRRCENARFALGYLGINRVVTLLLLLILGSARSKPWNNFRSGSTSREGRSEPLADLVILLCSSDITSHSHSLRDYVSDLLYLDYITLNFFEKCLKKCLHNTQHFLIPPPPNETHLSLPKTPLFSKKIIPSKKIQACLL
jgi:hypothetical protein